MEGMKPAGYGEPPRPLDLDDKLDKAQLIEDAKRRGVKHPEKEADKILKKNQALLSKGLKALPGAQTEKTTAYGRVITRLYNGEHLENNELKILGQALKGLKKIGKALSEFVPGRIKKGPDGLTQIAKKFIQITNAKYQTSIPVNDQPFDHLVIAAKALEEELNREEEELNRGVAEKMKEKEKLLPPDQGSALDKLAGPEHFEKKLNSNPSIRLIATSFRIEEGIWEKDGKQEQFYQIFDQGYSYKMKDGDVADLLLKIRNTRLAESYSNLDVDEDVSEIDETLFTGDDEYEFFDEDEDEYEFIDEDEQKMDQSPKQNVDQPKKEDSQLAPEPLHKPGMKPSEVGARLRAAKNAEAVPVAKAKSRQATGRKPVGAAKVNPLEESKRRTIFKEFIEGFNNAHLGALYSDLKQLHAQFLDEKDFDNILNNNIPKNAEEAQALLGKLRDKLGNPGSPD